MRLVEILVEGDKDAYFIRELLIHRFADSFAAEGCPVSKEKPSKTEGLRVFSKDKGIEVCLHWTNGYGAIKGLRRPSALSVKDEFVSGVVYDSDVPNAKNASNHPGQKARHKEIYSLLEVKGDEDEKVAAKYVFLSPDNRTDGDLEDLLRAAVSDTDDHRRFFEKAWIPFRTQVEGIPANCPTDKSMMNEYRAAFDEQAWDTNGLNLALSNANLWNWECKELDDLAKFLGHLIFDPIEKNLSDLLSK